MTKSQSKKIKQIPKLLRAIRLRCLDCSAYSIYEVKNCAIPNCPMFPYREGKIDYSLQKTTRKNMRENAKSDILQTMLEVQRGENATD